MSKMHILTTQVYIDTHTKCYKKVVSIDSKPEGTLGNYTKQIQSRYTLPNISTCCNKLPKCLLAFMHPDNPNEFVCVEQFHIIFNLIATNGYEIDAKLTEIMQNSKELSQNILCVIKPVS